MASLTILYWRDIPSQVIVKAGRSSAKRQLSERFIRAIDAAAMHAGAKSADAYLAEWRRGEPVPCGDDLEDEARPPLSGWKRNTIRIAWPCLRSMTAARSLDQTPAKSVAAPRSGPLTLSAHRVVFTPSGKRGEFAEGASLLEAARALGVDLDSVCGGRGICGRCQVDIAEGDFAKHAIHSSADHVTPSGAVEARYASKRGPFAAGRRLGCQARICGDLVIDVPPESQVHRQVVRKRAETHPIEIDPVVRLYYVEVAEPDMHEPSSDLRRLQQALREQWGLDETHADLAMLDRPAEGVARGAMEGHRRAAQRPRHRVHHAGLRRARLRRRDRCRLDHHRRPPHRSHERRGRRRSRGDEPADPLRRRSDEPRLLRDDEPGRRQGADARGARGDGRADRRSRARGRGRAQRNPGSDAGRQSDHASSRAWPRPDRARRGAVRA